MIAEEKFKKIKSLGKYYINIIEPKFKCTKMASIISI